MPEDVDFVTLAVKVLGRDDLTVAEAVAVFKGIWNGRGAALVDPVTNAVDEWVRAGGGTYDELQVVVEQAIKKLDR